MDVEVLLSHLPKKLPSSWQDLLFIGRKYFEGDCVAWHCKCWLVCLGVLERFYARPVAIYMTYIYSISPFYRRCILKREVFK